MEPFIGQIQLLPYQFAPTGWAFCTGQLIPIVQNQALFSLIGTTFGGDGSDDLRLTQSERQGAGAWSALLHRLARLLSPGLVELTLAIDSAGSTRASWAVAGRARRSGSGRRCQYLERAYGFQGHTGPAAPRPQSLRPRHDGGAGARGGRRPPAHRRDHGQIPHGRNPESSAGADLQRGDGLCHAQRVGSEMK